MDETGTEVFISSASEDYPFAEEIFHHLTAGGVRCFFSEQSMDTIGQAEYKRVIDGALEQCRHLVVVASSRANVEKEWVRYEWDTFAIERLSGRKKGNLITMACRKVTAAELPLALRQNQVLRWPAEKGRLIAYLGGGVQQTRPQQPPVPTPPIETPIAPTEKPVPPAVVPPSPPEIPISPKENRRPFFFRMFAAFFRFLCGPPVWRWAGKNDGSSSARRGKLALWGDFLFRMVRLVFLVAATLASFSMIMILMLDSGAVERGVPGFLVISAFVLWLGWLTSKGPSVKH